MLLYGLTPRDASELFRGFFVFCPSFAPLFLGCPLNPETYKYFLNLLCKILHFDKNHQKPRKIGIYRHFVTTAPAGRFFIFCPCLPLFCPSACKNKKPRGLTCVKLRSLYDAPRGASVNVLTFSRLWPEPRPDYIPQPRELHVWPDRFPTFRRSLRELSRPGSSFLFPVCMRCPPVWL